MSSLIDIESVFSISDHIVHVTILLTPSNWNGGVLLQILQ